MYISPISMLALVLFLTSDSLADGSAIFSCPVVPGAQQDTHKRVCKALEERLGHKFPSLVTGKQLPNSSDLRSRQIQLENVKMSGHSISGRLKWSSASGANFNWILGPVVETSISDVGLNDRAIHEFARNLVEISDIK